LAQNVEYTHRRHLHVYPVVVSLRWGHIMRRAFTLIELLVVLAVIAVLGALLFPVYARAREKGRQTACSSNVRQICMALLMYAQDHDDRFGFDSGYGVTLAGQARQWPIAIAPYLGGRQVLLCPSNPLGEDAPWTYWGQTHAVFETYAALWWLAHKPLAEIRRPAERILCLDSNHFAVGDWDRAQYARACPSAPACPEGVANRTAGNTPHNEGLNVGFVDGHVKWAAHTGDSAPPHGWQDREP